LPDANAAEVIENPKQTSFGMNACSERIPDTTDIRKAVNSENIDEQKPDDDVVNNSISKQNISIKQTDIKQQDEPKRRGRPPMVKTPTITISSNGNAQRDNIVKMTKSNQPINLNLSNSGKAKSIATKKDPSVPHSTQAFPSQKMPTSASTPKSAQASAPNLAPTSSPEPVQVPSEPSASPRDATRPGATEKIVYISHAELHPFKGHPFKVHDDDAMKALVESVKERGIDQPALVRPREKGDYELVSGHRRQHAAELAGYINVPCVVRNMTDDEAILAMTESNFNQRLEILPSERAKALKMQLDAIKHQGTKNTDLKSGELVKRSNEIVAERNKMSVKNVQRYITLNNLVPDLMKMVDDKKIKFTVAVDLSYIKPKNQRYIAVAIDAQESAPSGSQAQRMRELDQKGILTGDVVDGIMLEEKKEETRVIFNSQELNAYFGPEKTPREIKEQIIKLLDEWKERQPPELAKATKKKEAEI